MAKGVADEREMLNTAVDACFSFGNDEAVVVVVVAVVVVTALLALVLSKVLSQVLPSGGGGGYLQIGQGVPATRHPHPPQGERVLLHCGR